MRQHLQNTASRKNKTSQGTRQSLGAPAGVGMKVAPNNLNPLLDSLDSPRMANQLAPTSNQTLNAYASKDTETVVAPSKVAGVDYVSLNNTFKVSHLTRPMSYKTSQRLLNLQKPKSVGLKTRRKPNVYDRSDFRGLLYADYRETIDSVFTKKDKTLDQIQAGSEMQVKSIEEKVDSTALDSYQDQYQQIDGYDVDGTKTIKAFNNFIRTASVPGQSKTTKNAVSTNSRAFYVSQRRATMDLDNPTGSKSSNTIVKRPMTAFFSNNNTI